MTQPTLGTLNDSPAAVLAQIFIDKGWATDPTSNLAWPVSVDSELATPDSMMTLTDTEGTINGRVQVSGQASELFGVQLKIRAADPQAGHLQANAMAVNLDQNLYHVRTTLGVNQYFVGSATRKGSPLALGREGTATKRYLYTINMIVDIIQLQ